MKNTFLLFFCWIMSFFQVSALETRSRYWKFFLSCRLVVENEQLKVEFLVGAVEQNWIWILSCLIAYTVRAFAKLFCLIRCSFYWFRRLWILNFCGVNVLQRLVILSLAQKRKGPAIARVQYQQPNLFRTKLLWLTQRLWNPSLSSLPLPLLSLSLPFPLPLPFWFSS